MKSISKCFDPVSKTYASLQPLVTTSSANSRVQASIISPLKCSLLFPDSLSDSTLASLHSYLLLPAANMIFLKQQHPA